MDPNIVTKLWVSVGLFYETIKVNGSKEQWDHWVHQGLLEMPQRIIGCFAMTELAHGSNVAGFQTTATLDTTTDEFIIHTPDLGASKWWTGGPVDLATHCAVYAQLTVNGKQHGVRPFIVPLRDRKTFKPLPGITIGDIGPTYGRNGVDNAYMQFSSVRVPRSHLLNEFIEVTAQGKVTQRGSPQMALNGLIMGRVSLAMDGAIVSQKGLAIAIRYGAVRRQFSAGKSQVETQILDYPIHQRRLMPLLAQSVVIGQTGFVLEAAYRRIMETKKIDPELMKELHVTSAGLKAFSTWFCLDALEKCRQTMGGHGYSAYSSFPSLIGDFAVQCTWEGDNTIMMLQTGRGLLGFAQGLKRGKTPPAAFAYLKSCPAKSDGSASVQDIVQGFGRVTSDATRNALVQMETFVKQGHSKDQALDMCAHLSFVAARLHCITYLIDQASKRASELDPSPERTVVEKLVYLYALVEVEREAAAFLSTGYFGPEQIKAVQARVDQLCLEVRKVAIPITDAFGFSDYALNSPLGKYDGDVYNAYFETVQRYNPPRPNPYFESLVKPLLQAEPVDLRGKL